MRSNSFMDPDQLEESCGDFDNVDVPEILKAESSNPKIVEGEEVLTESSAEHKDIMSESFKLIDRDLTLQIINGPSSEPRMQLNIKKLKQLGGGSQADVY